MHQNSTPQPVDEPLGELEPLEHADPVDLVEVPGLPNGDRSTLEQDDEPVDPADPDFDHDPEGGQS